MLWSHDSSYSLFQKYRFIASVADTALNNNLTIPIYFQKKHGPFALARSHICSLSSFCLFFFFVFLKTMLTFLHTNVRLATLINRETL